MIVPTYYFHDRSHGGCGLWRAEALLGASEAWPAQHPGKGYCLCTLHPLAVWLAEVRARELAASQAYWSSLAATEEGVSDASR